MADTSKNRPSLKRAVDFATNTVKKDYMALPSDVKEVFDFAITELQSDVVPTVAKSAGEGLPGYVWKLSERDANGTYRCYYTVKLPGMVWVLHAFQKRSSSGISTPRGISI